MKTKEFKPELIPNSKTGDEFALTKNIKNPRDYECSLKHDGGRVIIKHGMPGLSRELKVLASGHLQEMIAEFKIHGHLYDDETIECEFYSPEMTFSEIMHFFKSSDVTSDKKKKHWANEWAKTNNGTGTYTKTKNGQPYEQGWEFVGRTPEWLTTWHDSLKLYAFNFYKDTDPNMIRSDRSVALANLIYLYQDNPFNKGNVVCIDQLRFDTHEEIAGFYDRALSLGEEGIVIANRDSVYKFGRHTMNSGNIFKLKEDKLEFDGTIIGVEEATEAREGSEKTVNELGRSKTSQLKEDRIPSGIAKGFLVMMEDGREFTVSLNGYNEIEKRELLVNKEKYLGEWIRFTGMAPVKHGGMPRQARFTKGNFRDSK
tara:strand:+ start:1381 stop:2493 length:1113 start_codon:yes stop_codon:yes gene_type:complete